MTWTYKKESYRADIKKYLSAVNCTRISNARQAEGWLNEAIDQSKMVKRNGGTVTADDPAGGPKVIDVESIKNTFKGTASPSQTRDTLWLATHLGLITNDKAKTSKRCEMPQDFADYYLGMECKGFALNYLGTPGGSVAGLDLKPRRRQELKDIQVEDIMIVWKAANPYHHIAIVTSTQMNGSSVQIQTVEAYGWPYNGLPLAGICSPYPRDLVKKSAGVFQSKNPTVDEFYFQPGAGHAPSIP
jgi:hypothetical protein